MRRFVGVVAVLLAVLLPTAAQGATPGPFDPTPSGSLQQMRQGQWYLKDMGILDAQKVTKGQGVTVCLLDTPLDPKFPGLDGVNVAKAVLGEGGKKETDSHGSLMTLLLAGSGSKGGALGSAPGVKIIAYGASTPFTNDAVASAARWCVDQGADVINLSLGGVATTGVRSAISYAQAHDVVVVAGTGNDGSNSTIGFPAGYFGVLSVSGVVKGSQRAREANSAGPLFPLDTPDDGDAQGTAVMGPYGLSQEASGKCVGFVRPETFRGSSLPPEWKPGCIGTSGATAVVSGVVALVRAAHPDLDAANVVNRVLATAKPPPGVTKLPDPVYGWGVVDASAAVSADVPKVASSPLGSLYTGSRGVWDDRVRPVRASPPVGGVTDPNAATDPPPIDSTVVREGKASPNPEATTAQGAAGSGGGVTGVVVGGLIAAVVVLALIGVAVMIGRSRRRSQVAVAGYGNPAGYGYPPGYQPPPPPPGQQSYQPPPVQPPPPPPGQAYPQPGQQAYPPHHPGEQAYPSPPPTGHQLQPPPPAVGGGQQYPPPPPTGDHQGQPPQP